MIRLFLIGFALAGAYLWAVENCRLLCVVFWFVVPFLLIGLAALVEKELEEC